MISRAATNKHNRQIHSYKSLLTKFSSVTVPRKREKLLEQLFAHAKRTAMIFDPVEAGFVHEIVVSGLYSGDITIEHKMAYEFTGMHQKNKCNP